MTDLWPWIAITIGAVVTYFWRALGVALAGRLSPEGRLIDWVTCVAYALLAGLIARMVLLPVGPLAEAPLLARLAAMAVGVGGYIVTGRNLLLGVLTGAAALAGLAVLHGVS